MEQEKQFTVLEKAKQFESNICEFSGDRNAPNFEILSREFTNFLLDVSNEELATYQSDFAERMHEFLMQREIGEIDKREPIFRLLTNVVLIKGELRN